MLSSTVLVSTATTPTGIPPSLGTSNTNQNSDFNTFFLICTSNTQERQATEAKGGSSIPSSLKSLGMWLENSRAKVTALKAKSSSKN